MNAQMDDAALRGELGNPGALAHAERRAKAAIDAARARGRLALGALAAIHAHAVATLDRQRPQPNPQTPAEVEAVTAFSVARLRHADAAQAAFAWLATLSDHLLGPIILATGEDRPVATRALCQQHEVWQGWCGSFDAHCAAIDAANTARFADQHAASLAAAPARALAAAEATGAVLTLDADGTTVRAKPPHLVPAEVRAAIREHKAAVVAILAERAVAEVIA